MNTVKTDVHDGKHNVMRACRGKTYAERKTDLLHQLGHYYVTEDIFAGMTRNEIDKKAREIFMS